MSDGPRHRVVVSRQNSSPGESKTRDLGEWKLKVAADARTHSQVTDRRPNNIPVQARKPRLGRLSSVLPSTVAPRSQPKRRSIRETARVPEPPGATTTTGAGQSAFGSVSVP